MQIMLQAAEKVTFDQLVDLIRADYLQKQNRTWSPIEHAVMFVV